MPDQPIKFGNYQQSGSDELGNAMPVSMNVVTEPSGAVRVRPGIGEYSGAADEVIDADGIDGVYEANNGKLYVTSGYSIYRVNESGALLLNPNNPLGGGRRPTFAETEMLLLLAAGSDIHRITVLDDVDDLLGGDPPKASHISSVALRLLANDVTVDKTKLRYTSPAIGTTSYEGHEEWAPGTGSAGYLTAEASPDPIVAHADNTAEVFAFGSRTTQIYASDPALVFAPLSALEVGIGAAASVVKRDSEFFWLDHKRRIVRSDGRGFEVISGPIQLDLNQMAQVSDCYGYHVLEGPCDALVWTFPSAGRTFIHQVGVGWGQWSGWTGTNWSPLAVLSHHLRAGGGQNLVGTLDGRVGLLSRTYTTDFDEPINAYSVTGFDNRGTSALKHCEAVAVSLRRGTASTESESAWLSWRDDPEAPWESPLEIRLGRSGEHVSLPPFRSVGLPYRHRQWRLQFDGPSELVVASVMETFRVLGG